MTYRLSSTLLILSLFLYAPPQALGQADPVSCDEKTVVASAVRTADDVQAFVQCAYEFVQDVGFAEAYRAFHEDERWRSGPIYVFVAEVTPMTDMSLALVQPPSPKRRAAVGTGDRCLRQRLLHGPVSPLERRQRRLDLLLLHQPGYRPR